MDERQAGPPDRRRKARHSQEIPDKKVHPLKYRYIALRWRLAVATVTHPVGVAMVVAMVICAWPLYATLNSQGEIRQQATIARDLSAQNQDQQVKIASLLRTIQGDRVRVTRTFCHALNDSSRTNNKQSDLFKSMIVGGAKGSSIFDALYRQYGGPPYPERVKMALKQARAIDKLKQRPLDCKAAVERIKSQAEPRPPEPRPPGPNP